ncbi:MAG TPA: hypothetical protein VF131_12810 [Blastocatellia bacterium]|nr:hypothetical protein [Blastocatellia bacterium]
MSSDDLTKQTPTPDRLDELISLVHNVMARLGTLEQRFGAFEQRLGALEQKVDERLHDTRPIWETVQAQITDLRESVQNQIAELRTEMTNNFQKLNRKFDVVTRKVDVFNEDLLDLKYKQQEHEGRIDKLEGKNS